jgi:hypothetical protein
MSGALTVTRNVARAIVYKLNRTNNDVKQLVRRDIAISRKATENKSKKMRAQWLLKHQNKPTFL